MSTLIVAARESPDVLFADESAELVEEVEHGTSKMTRALDGVKRGRGRRRQRFLSFCAG
jgi:hypothetical protein